MAEYIDKHEAYTLLKDLEAAYIYPPVREAYEKAARCIDQITPSDVQPVKHGQWEEIEEYGGWGGTYFRCSICGDEWDLDTGTPVENGMKYCPNCGARMDGDENV